MFWKRFATRLIASSEYYLDTSDLKTTFVQERKIYRAVPSSAHKGTSCGNYRLADVPRCW